MKVILLVPIMLALRAWNTMQSVWDQANAFANTQSDTTFTPDLSPIHLLLKLEPGGSDLRFLGPTTECACGSELWHIVCWFDPDEREVGGRFLEMACVHCGSICKSPTPID
jgi:hypothetical protein